jgi:hypothetical protein
MTPAPESLVDAPGAVRGAEFLARIRASFDQAAARLPTTTLHVALGSSAARMVFAGEALLERFAPAFAHLAEDADATALPADGLTVLLWDSASSGIQPPRPPWDPGQFLARGEISHNFDDLLRLSFRIDSGVLSLYDARTRTAICWVRDPAAMPPWEEAAPLRPILAWWAEHAGRQLAHGAAVGTADGAVLLAARGGSGKSTTALACLEAGMLYLGDDYVMLEPGHPPSAASLYATAKLIPANLDDRLPSLRAWVTGRHDVEQDKVTLSLHGPFRDQIARSLPLRAIIVPSLAPDGRLALTPATGGDALTAIAPTTLFQLPNAGSQALQQMAALVAEVPRYRLALDRDLSVNVQAIQDLIRREAHR